MLSIAAAVGIVFCAVAACAGALAAFCWWVR